MSTQPVTATTTTGGMRTHHRLASPLVIGAAKCASAPYKDSSVAEWVGIGPNMSL